MAKKWGDIIYLSDKIKAILNTKSDMLGRLEWKVSVVKDCSEPHSAHSN